MSARSEKRWLKDYTPLSQRGSHLDPKGLSPGQSTMLIVSTHLIRAAEDDADGRKTVASGGKRN